MIEKNLINELSPKGRIFLQIFLRFLKENNCFYKYKKAFENYKRANKLDRFILSCNNLSSRIVDKTLYWAETDEGFDYWENVNAQFEELCVRILI